ncbi:hypothetical protein BC831DRAFT_458700 [Entophlyctis helioformis]|nr:hypothetical protein BC831DRAFT_462646 [Entophlyctis helioformis]KAI8926015.1 hypothetical protein BC831DRAFT_458700 [Entophlyctis helioformis]
MNDGAIDIADARDGQFAQDLGGWRRRDAWNTACICRRREFVQAGVCAAHALECRKGHRLERACAIWQHVAQTDDAQRVRVSGAATNELDETRGGYSRSRAGVFGTKTLRVSVSAPNGRGWRLECERCFARGWRGGRARQTDGQRVGSRKGNCRQSASRTEPGGQRGLGVCTVEGMQGEQSEQ